MSDLDALLAQQLAAEEAGDGGVHEQSAANANETDAEMLVGCW